MLLECLLVISDVPEWRSIGMLLECSLVIILPLLLTLSSLTTALVVCLPRSGISVTIRLVLDPSCGKSRALHLLGFLSPSLCVYSSKFVATAISAATPVSLSTTASGMEFFLLLLWSYVPTPIIVPILRQCLLLPGILRGRLLTGHRINR